MTSGPLGANLFVPQPSCRHACGIERYAAALAVEAERYGAQLGEPRFDDDHWAAKLDVLLDLRPEVVSFTFGAPSAEECTRLREAGITTVGTVTTVEEARIAVDLGVDAVAAQGPEAGGHRGTLTRRRPLRPRRWTSCSPQCLLPSTFPSWQPAA